jgi:hypothetical protein
MKDAPFGLAVALIASSFWFGRGSLLSAGRFVLVQGLLVLGFGNGSAQRPRIDFVEAGCVRQRASIASNREFARTGFT